MVVEHSRFCLRLVRCSWHSHACLAWPLPFGEYLPLANVFPWLRALIQGPGEFGAGAEAVVAGGVVGMAFAVAIEP